MNLRFKLNKHQGNVNFAFSHIERGSTLWTTPFMTLPHFQLHNDMNVVKVLLEVEDCQWQDAGEGGQISKKAIQVEKD